MADNSPSGSSGDRSDRRGRKRAVEVDDDVQNPAQKSRRSIWNPFASSQPEYDPERDVGTPTPSPPPPTAEERAAHQRRTANLVDSAKAADDIKRILQDVEALNDPFDIDVTEDDEKWMSQRAFIVGLLKEEDATVLAVLAKLGISETSFQGLQLLPPKTQDLALELQRANTKIYKKSLGEGGNFANTRDNLATKLTMLHFGVPIEPLTLKNVMRCDKDDGNDSEDDAVEMPSVQRIKYSEKPLEFLDNYHERSFGYPMLRRPKPRTEDIFRQTELTPTQLEKITNQHGDDHHHHHHHHHGRAAIQPSGDLVSQRGGGGESSHRYLYSRYGASIKVKAVDNEVPADEFQRAALKALDLHPDSAWTIIVDQFDNGPRFKSTAIKPFVRSFIVTKDNFEKDYESFLKARISNHDRDWALSVDYYHLRMNGEQFNGPFSIPVRASNNLDVFNVAKLPKIRPPKTKDATHLPSSASTSPQLRGRTAREDTPMVDHSTDRETRTVFGFPDNGSQTFEDNAKSLTDAIKKLFPSGRGKPVSVSMFLKQPDNKGAAPLNQTMLFPLSANLRQYIPIQQLMFQETGYIAVVHEMIVSPPSQWPPGSKPVSVSHAAGSPHTKTTRQVAPLYRKNQGREIAPSSSSFVSQALRFLGIDPNSDWEFAVDLYSNPPGRTDGAKRALAFSHTIQITPRTSEKHFEEDIRPRLFGSVGEWNVVVRPSNETPVSTFTSFDVLPSKPATKFQSTNMPPPLKPSLDKAKSASKPYSEFHPAPSSPAISIGPSYIYGYGGKIRVEKNVTSFQAGALTLLGLRDVEGWSFTVDLHHTKPPTIIEVSAATISDRFERSIKNVPGWSSTRPWPVFVRKCNKVSTGYLEPPITVQDCVVLEGHDRVSYWKLPTPRNDRYSMNQIQDGFFAAMLVHYPHGSPRPAEDVILSSVQLDYDGLPQPSDNSTLSNIRLGFGGMEVTQKLYDAVNKQMNSYDVNSYGRFRGLPRASAGPAAELGIRLAGSERYSTFKRGDFAGLARAIRELSRTILLDHDDTDKSALSLPDQFRIWVSGQKRESNIGSHLFDYAHKSDLAEDLKTWFQREDHHGSTNCIWFRPEWRNFTVTERSSDPADMDLDGRVGNYFPWAADHDATLKSFRRAYATYSGADANDELADNFEIIVAKRNQRFVVNSETTEDQWRKHIYDYFLNDKLTFILNEGIQCVRDSRDCWGVLDMPAIEPPTHQRRHSHKITHHHRASITPSLKSQDTPHMGARNNSIVSRKSNASRKSNVSWKSNVVGGHNQVHLPVAQPPYEPRRIPGAKPPKFKTSEVPKFDKWMLNHTAQNTLQQRSWSQDQSVIEPGFSPAASLYGDIFELEISVGPSMPTVYIQHLTPTDISQLRKENRKLLNHVLEREIGCPICEKTFKAYDNDAKVAHYKSHMDALQSVGKCPICEEEWGLFTIAQKKEHLLADFGRRESEDIMHFWDDTACPICNLSLRYTSAENVTTHIAGHVPGALKFCARCGFDVLGCTPHEKFHHDRTCTRKTAAQELAAAPILCQNCGRERTPASEKSRDHDVCGNGYYCVRCGLNLSLLGPQEQHAHLRRCRVPGGTPGKHCKRCGEHLAGLSSLGLASHNEECYSREPISVATDIDDSAVLSQSVEEQRIKNAAERADLIHREAELRARENAILARETILLNREHGKKTIGHHRANSHNATSGHRVHAHGQISPNKNTSDANGVMVDICQASLARGDPLCPVSECRDDISALNDAELLTHYRDEHEIGRTTSCGNGPTCKMQSTDAQGADIYDMQTYPIPGCGFDLENQCRKTARNHFQTHAVVIPPTGGSHIHSHNTHTHHASSFNGPACHSDALNAALAEFKRRLPDFREAHATLQKLADTAGNAGTQIRADPRKTAEERMAEEHAKTAILKATNLLGVKRAKEAHESRLADELIRKLRRDTIIFRAELVALEEADPLAAAQATRPDEMTVASNKIQHADSELDTAEKNEEQRRYLANVALDQLAAQLEARKKAANFDGDDDARGRNGSRYTGNATMANTGDTVDGTEGTNAGESSNSGNQGNPSDPDGAGTQTGFLPSPPHPSFKKLPNPRRTRSVRTRAPATGNKRKKAAMDDGEDTMSGGGSVNLARSPSKRETKKMRMGMGERVAGGGDRIMVRGRMSEEVEGEVEGMSVSSSSVMPTSRVGRPRKMIQHEELEEDDGFEDVEEED